MSLSLTCKHCGTTVTADSENELVTRVQDHARTHDRGPELTAEHIRARLDRVRKAEPGTRSVSDRSSGRTAEAQEAQIGVLPSESGITR